MARVAKSEATLRVVGPDLDPAEITRLLACAADGAHARGEVLARGRMAGHVARTGLWSIRAQPREPGDLDASIAEVLARTTPDLDAWARVRASFRIDLFCGLFLRQVNEGLTISAASLLVLGERGIELDLDLYGSMHPISETG